MIHIGELWIQNAQDVQLARQWTQKLAVFVKLSIGNHARLTTAVSQIAQSLYYYSKCVHISFDIQFDTLEEAGQQRLQITLRESQNFIQSVEKPQLPPLSKSDLLEWLSSTQNLITRISILAEEGKPIEVTLAKLIPTWRPFVAEEEVWEWRETLQREIPQSLLEEILHQNQELIQLLDTLREKERSLEQKLLDIQELEKLRDELVHTLIHDLRNPLATIRACLSGLLYNNTKNLSSFQSEMLETSYLGARKMTMLVDNILDLHKLEQQGIPLESKPICLSDLITNVLQSQSHLALEKNIRLSRYVARNLPLIVGDEHLLERVLQNLIDNALKFTPAGERINIQAKCVHRQEKKGNETFSPFQEYFVSVSVKDTGPGISPDIENTLFEKFSTGFHDESGYGIGLAFCRMALQAHGGEIWAKNNPKKGTIVTFILPLSPPRT